MAGLSETERAELAREQEAAICAARCAHLAALAGDPAAREALGIAWGPIYRWQLERELPPEPLDPEGDEICLCP